LQASAGLCKKESPVKARDSYIAHINKNCLIFLSRGLKLQKTWNVKYCVAASLALATFILYLPALLNEFVYWDDNLYILENPHIRSLNTALFRWAFFEIHAGNWHPLTWISHAVDYALWGLNPLGHHLTNVVLHAANTFVVVLLVMSLLEILKERTTERGTSEFLSERTILISAGMTGLLFGIHPVHVESVAWVAERKDLLCALFFLLSVISYISYVRAEIHEAARTDSFSRYLDRRYLLTLGLFLLALLSKPMAVTLPVVLLILDWYPLVRIRSFKTLWLACVEKLPFITLSICSSITTILAQRAGNAVTSFNVVPLSARVLVAAKSLVSYLGKMLLPLRLTPYYPYPKEVSLFSEEYVLSIGLVIGITAACVVLVKKKLWLSAWAYYGVTLVPVIGIIQVGNQSMADRYTYLPSLGPFLVAGLCIAWISEKLIGRKKYNDITRLFSLSVFFALIVSLSYLTINQIVVWKNSVSLWTYVIDNDRAKDPFAYDYRGMVFYKAGLLDKAIDDFDEAIALDPQYAKAYYNRGSVFDDKGEFDMAIADYKMTIALDPLYYEAYYYLDQALKKVGRSNEVAH
jgi:protein O-mannosyl-transferase